MTLTDVLADARADADRLDRLGLEREAKLLRELSARVETAAGPWLHLLSEVEASLFSGWTPRMLRRRYPEWARRGLAVQRGRTRYYCEAILPRRANTRAAFAAGRDAARQVS